MHNARYFLLLSLALGGCQSKNRSDAARLAAPATTVVGTWQLARLESSQPAPTTVPNQRLVLTDKQQFQFFNDDQLAAAGSYALGTGSACTGGTGPGALLTVTPATPNSYAPHGNYELRGDTLLIDQCLAADGPRYTFRRQAQP